MRKLLVLFATQTGNAQDVAERACREARHQGYHAVSMAMDAFSIQELPQQSHVLFIASTTGQGETPSNMTLFWKFLLRRNLPADSLQNVRYAVFGLGDSGYVDYNVVAKKLDRRLSGLGAHQIIPKGLGDDQHPWGYEAALDPWLQQFWAALRLHMAPDQPAVQATPSQAGDIGSPKYRISIGPCEEMLPEESQIHAQLRAVQAAHQFGRLEAEKAGLGGHPAMLMDAPGQAGGAATPVQDFTPGNPAIGVLLENRRITAQDHFQDTRHIAFDLGDRGPSYEPGDILSIWPHQEESAVQQILDIFGLNGQESLSIQLAEGDAHSPSVTPMKASARDFVQGVLDINSASPRRFFFQLLFQHATDELQKDRLQHFGSIEGKDDLSLYCSSEGRTVLEVLQDFPSARMPFQWFVEACPKLQPRQFSIGSSQAVYPHQAHICLAVVRYRTPYKRLKEGLCSKWLANLAPGAKLPMWVKKGVMRLPSNRQKPIIMIGPGTGVAPFTAFLQQLSAEKKAGKEIPKCFLFFGCRNERQDFYYREEWLQLQKEGVLDPENGLVCAFSRSQQNKIYVTHKLRENRHLLWSLISQGGHIFVCGSASKMPQEVANVFHVNVMEDAGELTSVEAQRLMKDMKLQHRYVVEAWS